MFFLSRVLCVFLLLVLCFFSFHTWFVLLFLHVAVFFWRFFQRGSFFQCDLLNEVCFFFQSV